MFKKAYSHIAAAARGFLMPRPVHSPHIFEGDVPEHFEAVDRNRLVGTSDGKKRHWEEMGRIAFHNGRRFSPFTPNSQPDHHWRKGFMSSAGAFGGA